MNLRRRLSAACSVTLLLVVAGCSSNARSTGVEGGSFVFVSPGAANDFSYPEADRQTIGNFTGTSVIDESVTIALSDYPNTVLVLNYWGSWCGPCRDEADDLNVVNELSGQRGVQFLGINVKDTRQSAADFIAGKEVTFPSIYDPAMRTLLSMQGYPTTGIPSTIVLDRQHRVAHIVLGKVTAQRLDEIVAGVAAEGATGTSPSTGSDPSSAGTSPSAGSSTASTSTS